MEPKTIRLPKEVWARLQMEAEEERRPLNNLIWVALEEWLWARSRGVELRRDGGPEDE